MTGERSDAYVLGGGGQRGELPGFKATAADTAGAMSLLEFGLAAWQSGPDLHRHLESDESFYVLAGEIEFQVGDERRVLTPGEFAWVPRGTGHTFANAGAAPARALTIATPGGLESFFAENAEYLAGCGGVPDVEVLAEIRRRHDGQRLGPPIRSSGAPD